METGAGCTAYEKTATIELQGATWNPDRQPENCTIATVGEDATESSDNTLTCVLTPAIAVLPDGAGLELSLPIHLIPYQTNDFSASVFVTDTEATPSDGVQSFFTYVPRGDADLALNSDLAREISRILQIGSGIHLESIYDNFRSLNGCQDGGYIDTIYEPDYFFGSFEYEYVECLTAGVLFSGTVSSGFGRYYVSTGFSGATMSIQAPDFVEFTGDAFFGSEQDGPDTTTLNGLLKLTSTQGEVTALTGYSANCQFGEPVQPYRLTPTPDYMLEPINSVTAKFETTDRLLGGSRISVEIAAKFNNQGTIAISNDVGAVANIVIAAGPFPTIHIDLSREGNNEYWTIPWTQELAFSCQSR